MSDNHSNSQDEASGAGDLSSSVSQPPPAVSADASAPSQEELSPEQRLAKLSELDDRLQKLLAQKRWSEVIRTILAKVDLVDEPSAKVAFLAEAGRLYIERSNNHAESIKCFERILALDPAHRESIDALKDMYEKRRDWEKMIRVIQREIEMIEKGDERRRRRVEVAKLAMERLRKPDICIALWRDVLVDDAQDREALTNLVGLYERAREWQPLVETLEQLAETTADEAELKQLLQKLGLIYAEKVENPQASVTVYLRLLQIDPNDRRAEEQLKRRYVGLRAWDELEAFYGRADKWDDLIRIYEREAEGAAIEDEEKVNLLLRAAQLWQSKKGKADRAARLYEKVRESHPKNESASRALVPIYENTSEAEKLAQVYEVCIEHAASDDDKVELLTKLGTLFQDRLHQPDQAFVQFIRVFHVDPSNPEVRDRLDRLVEKPEQRQQVVDAYIAALANSSDLDASTELRLSLAQVYARFSMVDEAIGAYQQVYARRPEDMRISSALAELYRNSGRYQDLLAMTEQRIADETDHTVRRHYTLEKAKLYESDLKDIEKAIAVLESMLQDYGQDDQEVLEALARLYEGKQSWQDLSAILERHADISSLEESQIVALKLRLAALLERHIGDKEKSIELYKDVLSLSPDDEVSTDALAAMLGDQNVAVEAAAVLEPIYEARGRGEDLVRVLGVLADGAADAELRLSYMHKVTTVFLRQLRDAGAAFASLSQTFREFPGDEDTQSQLEALASDIQRHEDFANLVVEMAGKVKDKALSGRLWRKAADVFDKQLDNVEGAVGAYRHILDQGCDQPLEILTEMQNLYRRSQRWRDLVVALRRRLELLAGTSEKQDTLLEIAEIQETMLVEPREAILTYKEVLEIDKANQDALNNLGRLLESQQMWSDLADTIGQQLSLSVEDERSVDLRLRLAKVQEERLGAPDVAVDIFRSVLEIDEDNSKAVEALERLLLVVENKLPIVSALESVYVAGHEVEKLIGIYRVEVKTSSSPQRRIELLHRVAELQETSIGDVQAAFDAYAEALREDPSLPFSIDNLERIGRAPKHSAWLTKVYGQLSRELDDSSLRVAMHMRLADVYETEVDDIESAIVNYRQAFDLDRQNLEALNSLIRLYKTSEKYEELSQIYIAKAGAVTSVDERKEQLFSAASIYEDVLGQDLKAVDVYHKILAIEADNVEAIDKLIELYLKLEKWEPLLDAYTKKADVVMDVQEKKRLYVEVASVYQQELGDIDRAIATYQQILDIDPDDSVAIGRLDALYCASANWNELLGVLEKQAELANDTYEMVGHRFRIAELWSHKLQDSAKATEIYREILNVVPDYAPAIRSLEHLIEEGKESLPAAIILEKVYDEQSQWQKLIQVLEIQLGGQLDDDRSVELLHRIGALHEVELDDQVSAFAAYGRALAVSPENDLTLRDLERLAEEVGDWKSLAVLYDSVVSANPALARDQKAALAKRAAVIYETRLTDISTAIARFQVVLGVDADDVESIQALHRLYRMNGDWQLLAATLDSELAFAASDSEIVELRFELGEVYREQLGNSAAAIEHYREIIELSSQHGPTISALEKLFADASNRIAVAALLEPIYRSQDNWLGVIRAMEARLEHLQSVDERVDLLGQIADIAENNLGDLEGAFVWAQRSLQVDPLNDATVDELERLAQHLDGWVALAHAYASILEKTQDRQAKTQIARRMARVYEVQLGEEQHAEASYRYVLGVNPQDEEALAALDRIYDMYGAHEAAAEVLRRRVAGTEDPVEKVDLSFRLGQLLQHDLKKTSDAVEVYKRVLAKEDPQHRESLRALQGIYTQWQDWESLYRVLEVELEGSLAEEEQGDILARMAYLAADKLGDAPRAVGIFRKVLELRGEDSEALNALGDIYAAQEQWADLVDILEREAAIEPDDSARLATYSDLGRIWYTKLGRERNAIDRWESVIDIDPSNAEALLDIADAYRSSGANAELADTLHRLVTSCSSVLDQEVIEHVDVYLGYIYAVELKQPADAVEVYNQALHINPGSRVALDGLECIHKSEEDWDLALDVMQKRAAILPRKSDQLQTLFSAASLCDKYVQDPYKTIGLYKSALEIEPTNDFAYVQLDDLLRSVRDWDVLIEVYLSRAESVGTAKERIEVLRKIARIYLDEFQDPEKAFDALQMAWVEDFSNVETAVDLEQVAGPAQRWNELLTTANEALQTSQDSKVKMALCFQCARWYGKELGHPDYAIPYCQQILAIDPKNTEAMRYMSDMYKALRQWPVMAQVLARLVELTSDAGEKADGFLQLGKLCEDQLNDAAQAKSYYVEAIKVAPLHVGALEALEKLYRSSREGAALVAVLSAKAEALADSEGMVDARLNLAQAYEEFLEDFPKAIAVYREVLELESHNERALRSLEHLLTHNKDWKSLLSVLETQLEIVDGPRERIDVLMRIASIWELEFIKPEKAIEKLEDALLVDPTHAPALEKLAELYRSTQQWEKMVDSLNRHVQVVSDHNQQRQLWKSIGATESERLGADDRAIDAYLSVLGIDESDVEALSALAGLYQRSGDYAAAFDMLRQLESRTGDPHQRILLLTQMGDILGERLGDYGAAMEMFQTALDMDPGHLPTLEALRKIHLANSDWQAAATVLEKEAQCEGSARRAATRLVELGRLSEQYLDEPEKALAYYADALSKDPDSEEAALPLAKAHFLEERFQEALPLLRSLAKRATKRPPEEQRELNFLLGETALRLGLGDEAVEAFSRAHQIEASHLPSLFGLSAAYFRTSQWEQAFKFYQLLLVHHRDEIGSDQVADVFYHLGRIKSEQGERRKAINMFDKALEETPYHRPTIEALVALYEQQKEWEQVIQYKRRLLDVATEEESFATLLSIADVWREKARNNAKAIESYSEALQFKPDDHIALHKLLAVYQETKQWEEAIETIDRIAAADPREAAKSKYVYTIGVILRDELKKPEEALEKFDQSLDIDFEQLKAFEAINKILTQRKDWKNLERSFRKMIHRVVGKERPDLEFNLWHSLGLVYRDRLRSFDSAAEAFQIASRLKPEDPTQHQILAEVFAAMPGRAADAIGEHQWLLRHDPNHVASYQALYRLYFDASAYDKAWCVASTLVFLQKADKEQQDFFAQYRQDGVIRPKSRLDNEAWLKHVVHPLEDLYVGKIFEGLAPALYALRVASDKSLGIQKKHEVDPLQSTATVARTLGFAAQVLGMPMVPRLLLRPDLAGGLAYVDGSQPPATVCGAALLSGRSPQDLAFVVGRHLSFYRPEHFIRLMLNSSAELTTMLLAGMRLLGMGPEVPEVLKTAQQIAKHVPSAALESLRGVYRRLLESEENNELNMKRWMRSVELTGCRAGFLLSGDLETAARMIQELPVETAVDVPAKEKLKELVLFSVSESYFALREILGIQIQV